MSDGIAKALSIISQGAGAYSGMHNAFGTATPTTTAPMPDSAGQLAALYNPQPLGTLPDALMYNPADLNLGNLGSKLGKGMIKYGR